jgi:hypothetical protein
VVKTWTNGCKMMWPWAHHNSKVQRLLNKKVVLLYNKNTMLRSIGLSNFKQTYACKLWWLPFGIFFKIKY